MGGFAEKHAWLSTAPESGFVRVCVLQRRDMDGVDTLRALTLNRHGAKELIESPGDWWAAAGDVFGISSESFTAEDRSRVWERVVAQHEAHSGKPEGEAVVSV